MRRFEDYNPIVVFSYYILVAGITMFVMNPVILGLSIMGAVLLACTKGGQRLKTHLELLGFLLLLALINPLFQHTGSTVLFLLNDNPVTLEACVYGLAAATMIVAVIYWFRCFSEDLTSDKLLYLFGGLSPRLALLFSMTLRYIPLFSKQAKRVNQAQRATGLYKEDNSIDELRGRSRVFSVMVTWALENGIITADSMEARGYGIGKRSSFSIFRFGKSDLGFLLLELLLSGLDIGLICTDAVDFDYYPVLSGLTFDFRAGITYITFGILVLLPTINNLLEGIRWKFLQSKI